MNRRNKIRSIVHGHLRFVIERGFDMLVIRHIIFAFDGIRRDFKLIDQHRRNIILRGQRVGGGQDNIRSALLKNAH